MVTSLILWSLAFTKLTWLQGATLSFITLANISVMGLLTWLSLNLINWRLCSVIQIADLDTDLDSKAQLVIDLKENQLEAKSEQYFGTSFASPDGRFIITLNYYAILTQYIDPAGQIFLFPEIESNILLSHLAVYPRNAGYDLYVTSKDQSTIIVLHVDQRGIDTLKFISSVGKPLQEDWIHTQRPIVIGCEAGARYLATPATGEDAVIILDAERKEMSGKVGGIKGAQTILWVENQQE